MSDPKTSHANPAEDVREEENVFGQSPDAQAEDAALPEVPTSLEGKSREPENYPISDPHGDNDPGEEASRRAAIPEES